MKPNEKSVRARRLQAERRWLIRADCAVAVVVCSLTMIALALLGRASAGALLLTLAQMLLTLLFLDELEPYDHFYYGRREILVCILLANLYAMILCAAANACFVRSWMLLLLHAGAAAAGAAVMLLCNLLMVRHFRNPRCYRKPSLLVLAAKGNEARLRRLKYGIQSGFNAWYMVMEAPHGEEHASELDSLKEMLLEYDALCLFDNVWGADYEELVRYAMERGKEIYTVPRIIDVSINQSQLTHFSDIPVLFMQRFQLTAAQRFAKRTMDLAVALAALVVTALPMAIIALCIRLDSPGPVIYRQQRYTKDKRIFNILKFRTMVADAEKLTGPTFAQKDDPRITRVGRILRACRLDELPQIFNILRGDMSLVGPRPERPYFVEQFEKEILQYDYRFSVKAGLTALSHVYGRYSTYIQDRTYYDLRYIAEYSLLLDLRILLLTSKTMFLKDAAEGEDQYKQREIKPFQEVSSKLGNPK